jgi:hypothetical protein
MNQPCCHVTIFYEIYPDLKWQAADSSVDWVEVALHADTAEYRPAEHPKIREALLALEKVADVLTRQIDSPCSIDRSNPYFTLHPPASGDVAQMTLSLTLSIVYSNIGSYTQLAEPSILSELRHQLSLLGVSKFQEAYF